MNKLRTAIDGRGRHIHSFHCVGCGHSHGFDDTWTLSGSIENPTVQPSLLTRWNFGEENKENICHLFITEGRLHYLGDCTHEYAGKIVDMQDEEE